MTHAKPAFPPGIYGITARRLSAGRSAIEVVAAMIEGGVRIVQYREKLHDTPRARIVEECRAIRRMTREAGVLFIVNDHVEIACEVEADGVHVGQDDPPVAAVRAIVGENRLIGLSTHSPGQAAAAAAAGADYIGVGPLFATQTKDDVCAPVGLAYLEHVVRTSALPFVAIGGINAGNIDQVVERGAKTVCLVSAIVGAADVAQAVRRFNARLVPCLNPH